MQDRAKSICKTLVPLLAATVISLSATGEAFASGPTPPFGNATLFVVESPWSNFVSDFNKTDPDTPEAEGSSSSLSGSPFYSDTEADDPQGSNAVQTSQNQRGLVSRSVHRILEDQKGIYRAPFEPAHLKYDAIVLGGTALFLATDRHIENNLPGGHYQFYQDTSNIAIAGLATTLGGVWLYGIRGDHPHARETGEIELETLVNTFLVYAPMQFIAGRQRPGEGNGNGDFFKHHMINTSFPGGHAMFTWAMATVVAHEYSQNWVRVLNYGAAFTVTLTRFLARDHWASDMWIGTGLGLGIGTYTFHQRCDPELSASCKRHYARIFKKKTNALNDYDPFGPDITEPKRSASYAMGRPISQ